MISAGTSSNSIISVLIPGVVGAVLGFAGALFLRRGEHRWQQARENNQRDWEEKRERNQRAWAEARESQQRDLEEQRERHDREWQEQRELQAREWQAEQQRLAHEREVAWQKQRDWFIAVTEVIPSLDAALSRRNASSRVAMTPVNGPVGTRPTVNGKTHGLHTVPTLAMMNSRLDTKR